MSYLCGQSAEYFKQCERTAVRRVQLDSVETCFLRHNCPSYKVAYSTLDLLFRHRARNLEQDLVERAGKPTVSGGIASERNAARRGGGRKRRTSSEEEGRLASGM